MSYNCHSKKLRWSRIQATLSFCFEDRLAKFPLTPKITPQLRVGLLDFYNVKRSRSRLKTQGLVIINPSTSAIAPSSEGGCLSSAMLRAKIDLRQPSFLLRPRTVTATVSSQGLKNTQFPRFGAEIILHIIGMRKSLGDPQTQRSLHRRSHELAA